MSERSGESDATFIGSVALIDALYETYREHIDDVCEGHFYCSDCLEVVA